MKMKNISFVACMLGVTGGLIAPACAGTLYLVATNGAHIPPYDTWAHAATNIQAAVDCAQDGDMALVEDGVHFLAAPININKGITVVSRHGAGAAVVTGGGAVRCFEVRHPDAVLDGFTITDGSAACGGGVWITNGLIRNCAVTGNYAQLFGGGVDVQYDGLISKCVITGNRTPVNAGGCGGGICVAAGGTVRNCEVSGNEAANGGGLYMFDDTTVADCVIISNRAWDTIGWGVGAGGGVFLNGPDIALENSVVAHNISQETAGGVYLTGHVGQKITGCLIYDNETGRYGGGLYANLSPDAHAIESCTVAGNRALNVVIGVGGGICSGSGQALSFRNTIAYFNTAGSGNGHNYHVVDGGVVGGQNSCAMPAPAGAGNIAGNPVFTADYRLAAGSPCINAGVNQAWMAGARDVDGKPRIIGGVVDMGACEYGAGAGYTSMVLRLISPADDQVFGLPSAVHADMRAEQEWGGGGITQTVVWLNGALLQRQAWNNERYCMIDFDLPGDMQEGTYFMTLEARDAHAQTATTSVCFTVVDLLPGTPTNVLASAGDLVNAVQVSWNTAANAASCEVWRADGVAPETMIVGLDACICNYTDSNVTAGAHYTYRVRAVNDAGAGAFSKPAIGWPLFGPAIRLNGVRALELPAGSTDVETAVLLGVGDHAGTACDWWLVAHAVNTGELFYMDAGGQLRAAAGLDALRPARQGAVFDITSPYIAMLEFNAPADAGMEYRFYFGLDTRMNGQLDQDVLVSDEAVLTYR